MTTDYRTGIRKSSPIGAIAAAATGTALHTLSAGRTVKVRKLHAMNNTLVNGVLTLGAGLGGAFVAATPGWFLVAGMDLTLTEADLPDVEFTANITCAFSGAPGAFTVDVQIEVEEFQGPTG